MKDKKEKVKKTGKQKFKTFLKVLGIIVIVIAVIVAVIALLNALGNRSNKNFVKEIPAVTYENQLVPAVADDGYYSFETDRDLRVMQLTDIHIGGGILSAKKDNLAINAVSAMVTAEKPDLVVVTGDIAYPVPFQSLTFNNKTGAVIFAELMEQLGVYWAPVFGNHDTEAYSFYSREQIYNLYTSGKYPHCLMQAGPEDVSGVGNYVVNVRKPGGEITESLFMLDSHSYTDNDYFGILWKYDTFHEDQVKWYEDTVNALAEENGGTAPKSLAFFHIPIPEFKEAYDKWAENGFKDTDDVKYVCGDAGEHKTVVYASEHNYGFFDKVKELGSTQALFCGHDHLNNFALDYEGIRMAYSYSVDYLAYVGIMKYGVQRGCTMIDVKTDGSYEATLENYYQDKYAPVKAKEPVLMEQLNEDPAFVEPVVE